MDEPNDQPIRPPIHPPIHPPIREPIREPIRRPAVPRPRPGRLPPRVRRALAGPAGVALAALALFAALAAFGARVHWVEEVGTAERDGYVLEAEILLEGRLPRDPYRPLLYPLAAAGLGTLLGDPFAAARLLSNAAAAALAALAFAFGRRLADSRAVGWWAFGATALNPNLWTIGQHVTTDVPFAALAGASLLAAFAYLERPGWRAVVLGGAALALAAFTRANAAFLVPAWLAAWYLAPRPARRLRHLAALAVVTLLVLAPHFALRHAQFGDPFHDENWKNLAYKLYGWPDWSYLERVPYDGPWEVVAANPVRVLGGGMLETWRFLRYGFWQLVGTPLHALLFLAGAGAALAVRRRRAGWLLFAGGTYTALVALAFFTWGRLLLVLLPIAAALAYAPFAGPVRERVVAALAPRLAGARPAALRRLAAPGTLRRALALVGALALAGLAVKTFVFRLPAFADRHPYAEVAALRTLAAEVPEGTVIAGVTPFLGRYVDRDYVYVHDAFGPEIRDPERYYAALRERLEETGADYLLVAEIDLRDRPAALLGEEPPAPWLEPRGGDDEARVWRVRLEAEPEGKAIR